MLRLTAKARRSTQFETFGLKIEPTLLLLQEELGYRFKDPQLLMRALTHVSYDRQKSAGHNEVLEFLGDAVLDLAVSDLLMRHNPERSEGDLSRMRAALVNSAVLADKAALVKLGASLRLGKGGSAATDETNHRFWPAPSKPCSGVSIRTVVTKQRAGSSSDISSPT